LELNEEMQVKGEKNLFDFWYKKKHFERAINHLDLEKGEPNCFRSIASGKMARSPWRKRSKRGKLFKDPLVRKKGKNGTGQRFSKGEGATWIVKWSVGGAHCYKDRKVMIGTSGNVHIKKHRSRKGGIVSLSTPRVRNLGKKNHLACEKAGVVGSDIERSIPARTVVRPGAGAARLVFAKKITKGGKEGLVHNKDALV